jgi:hypothetical protein
VALRYPNGRSREESLAGAGVLRPGDHFDLYGRRWTAVGPVPVGRYGRDSGRILCTSTGHTAPAAPEKRDELRRLNNGNGLNAVSPVKR